MHLLVCYDVVEDARRNRLFKGLKGFLRPVQKSVFDGALPPRRYPDLLALVTRHIDHATDTVRIYSLCGGCRNLVDLLGTARPLPEGPEDVVV